MGRSKNIYFFNNYKFFINPNTNEIIFKFICNDCKKELDPEELGNYQFTCTSGGIPEYHKVKFWCKDCCDKKKEENIPKLKEPQNNTELKPELICNDYKKENKDGLNEIYSSLYKTLGTEKLFSKQGIGKKLSDMYHQDSIDVMIHSQKYFNGIPKEDFDKILKANNSILDKSNEVKNHGL